MKRTRNRTARSLVLALWGTALGAFLGAQPGCCDDPPPPEPPPCTLEIAPTTVANGVHYYDCSTTERDVHVVRIDRNRGNSEIWLLDIPLEPLYLLKANVRHLTERYNAVVGINGYTWHYEILSPPFAARPTTTTYETGIQITPNTSECDGHPVPCPEVLMGFTDGRTEFEPKRVPAGEAADPKYHYTAYGSNTTIKGHCKDDPTKNKGCGCMEVDQGDDPEYQSIIGYSSDHVVFLTTGSEYKVHELCPVLDAFSVTDAILQDGGGSARMFIRDMPSGGLDGDIDIDPSKEERAVAYALGLVDLYPLTIVNAGFEEPQLASGEPWRRMNTSTTDTLTGWEGPVDLHSGTDLIANGSQIVDLNQTDHGFLQTSLNTPPGYCLLRFFHGLNHYCTDTATFNVMINGIPVQSFMSTSDAPQLKEESVRFLTTESTTLLRFESTTFGCGGATIDDVSVSCTRM